MKKFGQILALVFVLAFGYGLGQHAQDLFATDYPTGGAGGGTHPVNLASDVTGELPHAETSDDSADVHGLDSGAFVLGNLDAAAEFIQRGISVPTDTPVTTTVASKTLTAVTYGTAFSATPIVVLTMFQSAAEGVGHSLTVTSTTGFTAKTLSEATISRAWTINFIAVGS